MKTTAGVITYMMGLLLASAAMADWNPGDPYKWAQLPDVSTTGMDVRVDSSDGSAALADDFLCTETGSVTEIHLWASWFHDQKGTINGLGIAFYSDVPADPDQGIFFSRPGQLLWSTNLVPDQFTERLYASLPPGQFEWWWWIGTPELFAEGDTGVWQVNISINATNAFVQTGSSLSPQVYWLVVSADTGGQKFGWKTANTQWNDDAVYAAGGGPWQDLTYPGSHPLSPQGVGFAFVLNSTTLQNEPTDFGDAPDGPYPTRLASDGARHRIVPGVFLGAGVDAEADGQPNGDASGDDLTGLDDEDGVILPAALLPGSMANISVLASTSGVLNAWIDLDHNGTWAEAYDHVFSNVVLVAGLNNLNVNVPMGLAAGNTFGRFRFTTQPVAVPAFTGLADDGEVEDYPVAIQSPVESRKWSQPPDRELGIDLQSWTLSQTPPSEAPHLADDWLCDGRPINGVKWWGSYATWAQGSPETNQPPPPERPIGFNLTWYTDVPAAGTNASRPGAALRIDYYPLAVLGIPVYGAGTVVERSDCVSSLSFVGPTIYEHEYSYFVEYTGTNLWNEKRGRVYWLGIEAVYVTSPTNYPWGWATTPPEWNWNDRAVYAQGVANWQPLTYPPNVPPWGVYTNHPDHGRDVDLAYELYSDVPARRCEISTRYPDMAQGVDMASWRRIGAAAGQDLLRADDFTSDGRPITDLHWWGSYIGWQASTYGTETNPIAPPAGNLHPVAFQLALLSSSNGLPGASLGMVVVSITNCHETFYGTVPQYWVTSAVGTNEHEYQYYVDLLNKDVLGSAWTGTPSTQYWISVQAVFPANFETGLWHQGWGWKIAPDLNLHPSAVSTNGDPWVPDHLLPPHLRAGQSFDLAFELTTTNIPKYAATVLTNLFVNTYASQAEMWSTGFCGCGILVLQESTDLTATNGWGDVITNALPRDVNFWRQGSAAATQRFYRIQLRN